MHILNGSLKPVIRVAAFACAGASHRCGGPGRPPAQQWHVPLQKEGATVKLSEHVYLIPDFKVGMVPNVGIIVGQRATLVVDPGMGMQNGQVVLREVQKVSKGSEIYIVNTHFHPEHTTGEVAFPPSAKVLRAAAQQQDVEEMGMKWVAHVRQPLAGDRGSSSRTRRSARRPRSSRRRRCSTWAACGCGSSVWARATRAATPSRSSRATACSSPATSR